MTDAARELEGREAWARDFPDAFNDVNPRTGVLFHESALMFGAYMAGWRAGGASARLQAIEECAAADLSNESVRVRELNETITRQRKELAKMNDRVASLRAELALRALASPGEEKEKIK